MFAIGTAPLSAAAYRTGGAGAPLPAPPVLTRIVIEGDSITSTAPSIYAAEFYSYRYDDSRTDKTIEVRAQNSRSIGDPANLNDNTNTLFGNVAEDAAYAPDLLTMKIGANDFTGITDATYRSRLIALRSAYSSARGAMKVAWSAPIAYNPTGTPHPSKGTFDTQRASLLADCRNPAVWGQWADFYLPMGEIPEFGDAAVAAPLFGDSVHPSAAGQLLLFASYKAAMDSLLDASRATSTTMYGASWIGSETNLAVSTEIVRRIVVSGLSHTGTVLGASVSGGGAQIRVGGRAWGTTIGTGSGNGHRLYNGDILELKLTTSASNNTATSVNLTIGSETRSLTYTTVAAVTPASYTHGGFAERNAGTSATHTFSGVTFPAAGVGLIVVNTLDGGPPSSVTFDGSAATLVFSQGGYLGFAAYRVAVTAGQTGNVVVTLPASKALSAISYGTVQNADPTPVSASANAADNGAHPAYATASVTVPASGIALGFLGQYGDNARAAGSVTGAGNTQFVSGFSAVSNGEKVGVIGGRSTANGSVGFSFDGFGTWPVGIVVFKAAGG